ncbi:hypothetical protein [Microcoleus asticus]|uniref:hypothetical protein n=1 Tax=Microcoleus asticus TaxID=2815231 RepID=UPI001C1311C7|nr:hypothetical protein [Microcoleus asticus]
MFWVYASEMCERAFNSPLRTFGLSVRLTFSHNGESLGENTLNWRSHFLNK